VDKAVEYFRKKGDQYKLELLEDLKGQSISMYHHGQFTDLCYGPHIPSTGRIKAIKLLNVAERTGAGTKRTRCSSASTASRSDQERVGRAPFRLEEAKRRDHRKLGQELELFLLTPAVGSGLPLWMPKGTVIRESLIEFLRDEQRSAV